MDIFKNLKPKHRSSGMLILLILFLQVTYVNFVGQKENIITSAPHQILNQDNIKTELSQKRHIKQAAVSQISMNSELNCQIQHSQIKCTNRESAAENIYTPPQLPVSISSTQQYSCLIDKDSSVYCWLNNSKAQTLNFNRISLANPAVQISSNNTETCTLLKTGEVFCWKQEESHFSKPEKKLLKDELITSISSFGSHHCAANENGNVTCWGENYTSKQFETSQIQLREKALFVSTGPSQDCIVTKKNRELICWNQDYSQLDKAPNLNNIHEVSLSENLSCGLTFDGNVYCWQNDNFSSLKLQLNSESDSSKLIALSSNNSEICGLSDDQRVVCWNQLKK